MRLPLADTLCYALLTITVTASCAQAESGHTQDASIQTDSKKITKRETTLLIDTYPVESRIKQPKVIYRRISKYPPYRKIRQHFGQSGAKFGVKHKNANYQNKKLNYKMSPLPRNKRTRMPQRPRYLAPKQVLVKHAQKVRPSKYRSGSSLYKSAEKNLHQTTEPTGFGEPPLHYSDTHELPTGPTGEADVLVDSYGAPLKSAPTGVDNTFDYHYLPDNSNIQDPGKPEYDNHKHREVYRLWQQSNTDDNIHSYTKNLPVYVKQKSEESPYKSRHRYQYDLKKNIHFPKNKPTNGKFSRYAFNSDREQNYNNIQLNRLPRYPQNHQANYETDIDDDQIVVGGQYAEPPGRYIPKHHKPATFEDTDDALGIEQQYDSEMSNSATVSSYVNYKNSNMAFSPQNLNDAFGPVVETNY